MNYIKYFLIIILFSDLLFAQTGGTISLPDARTVAMGSQTAVTSTGVYSILGNPANLAKQKANIEVSTIFPIPSINLSSKNSFLSFNEFQYYFGGVPNKNGELVGRYLDQTEKEELLSRFSGGVTVQANSAINLFSISVSAGKEAGSFGFSINDLVGQKTTLPSSLIDLLLFGNETERIYSFNDLTFSTSYLREYAISYARDFSSLTKSILSSFSAGITLKLIHGYAYSEIESINSSLETLTDQSILIKNNLKANMAFSPAFGIEWDWDKTKKIEDLSLFPKPAGTGFGVNLGFAADIDNIWLLGLSITDIGSVSWDTTPVTYKANGSVLIANVADSTLADSIKAALEPTGGYTNTFTSSLPTVLRLGVALRVDKFVKGKFPGEMLIALGYNQGFINSINTTRTPLFSLGLEWKLIKQIQLRSGIAFGGFDGFAWSLGLGLDFNVIEINLASADMISVMQGNDTKVLQFTLGSRWKF